MLALDFETYSGLDLAKVGLYRYAEHPSTEVLMASYVVDQDQVRLWVPAEGEPMPALLRQYLEAAQRGEDGALIGAYNAAFERIILRDVLGLDIAVEQFRCTMVHAWCRGFAGHLSDVGAQMGLRPDRQKLADGKKLINRFCKPAPRNHKADRYDRHSHPEEWARFKSYCVQDTIAEREMAMILSPYPMTQGELDLWFLDQRINDRGVPIDLDLVDACVKVDRQAKREIIEGMNLLTGLDNAGSATQLKAWLEEHGGLILENMQKEYLANLAETLPDSLSRLLIQMRLDSNKTSTTKWQAFQRATCEDGRLRGMFQFSGAQRTGRWAGRIVQLHNLKRPSTDDADTLYGWVDQVQNAPESLPPEERLRILSETLRCAITAPEERTLVVCDLASIESRVLGWTSGCHRINEIFAQGLDTYRDFATVVYGIPYDQVDKVQRTWCKPPVLGCGYQLGGPGLVAYAEGMGVTLSEEEAGNLVDLWRKTYPEVPAMWYWLIDACMEVAQDLSCHTVKQGYAVRIRRDENYLMIDLPTDRTLYYYQPLVQMLVPPWEKDLPAELQTLRPTLTYMGMNQYTRKWVRLTTHGGKITENIVQAVARDILAYDMRLLSHDPGPRVLPIIGHVHDELILEGRGAQAAESLQVAEAVMATSPSCLPGLILGAEGFVTKRYRKG